jgi:SAM-dependent methyltransferase
VLKSVLRQLLRGGSREPNETVHARSLTLTNDDGTPHVLNVGGNSKAIAIPGHYYGWRHLLLDIDPASEADLVCDARELHTLTPSQFDAVYCSHNLEHYFPHDVKRVLNGFMHVLRPGGFAEIRVPDIEAVMREMMQKGLDIEDVLYHVPSGPILVRDVLYGWQMEIERSGRDFFAHKTGFSPRSLVATLRRAGFAAVEPAPPLADYEARAFAFKLEPTGAQRALLNAQPVTWVRE